MKIKMNVYIQEIVKVCDLNRILCGRIKDKRCAVFFTKVPCVLDEQVIKIQHLNLRFKNFKAGDKLVNSKQ